MAEQDVGDMMQEHEQLIAFGGNLKAFGDGKVGGYLVVFTSESEPDLYGDYFTKDTDFGLEQPRQVSVFYQHGYDETLKSRRLGYATIEVKDAGVWMEAQLSLRDEYEQAIYQLVENGKMGLSSGALGHLVETVRTRKAYKITRWEIGEASITPTPAEPKTSVVPLRSLFPTAEPEPEATPEGADAPADAAKGATVTSEASHEEEDMNPELEALKAQMDALDAQVKQVQAQIDSAPANDEAGFQTPDATKSDDKKTAAAVKAWGTFIRSGDGSAYKAAMQVGTDSEGGYLVPIQYANELVTAMNDASLLRQAGARVITMTNAKTWRVPSMTNSTTAVLTAEEAAFTQLEPTVGEIVFTPYKYTTLSKVSDELLEDSSFDVTSQLLVPNAVNSFALAENTAFTTGTGSSQPQGVVTGASAGVTAASASAITADEVIDLYHSLGYLYRQNAVWMMNDATIKVVRKLKDTTNQYLWQPGMAAGQPDRLLGRPVFTNNNMATIATTAKTILFGDMRYYWIVDFGQQGVKRLEELYAANGQVGFRWYKRFDAHVVLSAAIKVLTQA